jgi:micrococcal nuclease
MKYLVPRAFRKRRWLVTAIAVVGLVATGSANAQVWLAGAPPVASPGRTASVGVYDYPARACAISVVYKSGPSHAQGLYPKWPQLFTPQPGWTFGSIGWSWVVGTNTTRGVWPIYISCGDAGFLRTWISVF